MNCHHRNQDKTKKKINIRSVYFLISALWLFISGKETKAIFEVNFDFGPPDPLFVQPTASIACWCAGGGVLHYISQTGMSAAPKVGF